MLEKIKDNQKGFNFVPLEKRALFMPHPVLYFNCVSLGSIIKRIPPVLSD